MVDTSFKQNDFEVQMTNQTKRGFDFNFEWHSLVLVYTLQINKVIINHYEADKAIIWLL